MNHYFSDEMFAITASIWFFCMSAIYGYHFANKAYNAAKRFMNRRQHKG